MPIRRIINALFLLALALPIILGLMAGCEESPTAPVFDSIFDPSGPQGGNPLKLTATLSDSAIILSWTQPQGYGISNYDLSHSLNFFGDYLTIGSVVHSENTFGTFRYENPNPTATHYFKIQAFDEDGNFTNLTDQSPASRTTPPLVAVGDQSGLVVSRNIILTVVVSAGDSLRISNDRDFAQETRVAVAEPGQPQDIPWVLPQVDDNDTTLAVRVLAFPLAGVADTAVVELDVDFAPAFTIIGEPATVPSQRVTLAVPNEGVVSMRFANSEDGLADQAWQPGAATQNHALANTANPQEIWGEFLGDFGFYSTVSLTVIPDLLTDAAFYLDLPEDHVTDQSIVTVVSDAVATHMRFSESQVFTSVLWRPYSDTSHVSLSPDPGQKVVYAQFRNDWLESAILTDYVIYLSQALEVAILAPAAHDPVPSGTAFSVLGTATAPSGQALVDSVKFDPGDGAGFRTVIGTNYWNYLWDVPAVTEETTSILRARAWAAEDSVTTSVAVVLLPEVSSE